MLTGYLRESRRKIRCPVLGTLGSGPDHEGDHLFLDDPSKSKYPYAAMKVGTAKGRTRAPGGILAGKVAAGHKPRAFTPARTERRTVPATKIRESIK